MESPRQAGRLAAIAIAFLISACASKPGLTTASAIPMSRPKPLSIAQVGDRHAARFVFCEAASCAQPSVKTPPTIEVRAATLGADKPSQGSINKPLPVVESSPQHVVVDVPFEFNSVQILPVHAKRVQDAVTSAPAGSDILITGRSDNVGPPRAQGLIAQARRLKLLALVAPLAHGSRVSENLEVAPPGIASPAERAMQRRGSVDISTPHENK